MKPRILVVDDDDDVRLALMEFLLEEEKYDVAGASDGERALEDLHANPETALVVLDLMMPNMNGLVFRKLQLADPEIRDIPIVIFTAFGKTVIPPSSMKFCGLINKPGDLDQIIATVERCVRRLGGKAC